jgi:hypothetical protein
MNDVTTLDDYEESLNELNYIDLNYFFNSYMKQFYKKKDYIYTSANGINSCTYHSTDSKNAFVHNLYTEGCDREQEFMY